MDRAPSKTAAAERARRPRPKEYFKPTSQNRSPLRDINAFTSRGSCNSSTYSSTGHPPSNYLRVRSSKSSSDSSKSNTNPQIHHNRHRSDCSSANPRNPPNTTKPRLKSSKPLAPGPNIGDRVTQLAAKQVPNVNRLRRCEMVTRKKVISTSRDDLLSRSRRLEEAAGESGKDFEFTPICCKTGSMECGFEIIAVGSNCDKNGDVNGNTPPAEVTVSPEIQCGSNVISAATTPVCFGAGHVLSGVSDKRKCRPRGVLVVGDNCKGIDGQGVSNEELDGIEEVDGGCGMIPLLPAEASMHWLLSPCEEDADRIGENELHTSVHLQSSLSGSSGYGTSSNAKNEKNIENERTGVGSSPLLSHSNTRLFQCLLESTPDNTRIASSLSLSPSWTGGVSCFDEMIHSNLVGSSFSKDTLGSKNVIQTPKSYSSSERHMSLPWFHANNGSHAVESNLHIAADGRQGTRLSSEGEIPAFEQIDSSFEFCRHLKPASSIEFSELQYNWDKSLWISDAIVEKELQSQFRIPWSDSVSSHLSEMDDSDCNRFLSIEADKNHQNSLDPANTEVKLPAINTVSYIEKINVKSAGCMSINKKCTLQKDIQCAESISLDGGSLAASGDSEWDVCYKNNLFQVD